MKREPLEGGEERKKEREEGGEEKEEAERRRRERDAGEGSEREKVEEVEMGG